MDYSAGECGLRELPFWDMDYSAGECGLREVQPSTSNTCGRRRSHPQGESSGGQPPLKKQQCDTIQETNSEQVILNEVKTIMDKLNGSLNEEDVFHNFLKTKIKDLERDKRELVGVFGKTGAGKSSLINAIIGEKNLLPSGCISACTAVMIKVEAVRNVHNPKYEAEIEFIAKEEWEEELRYVSENTADLDNEDDDDYYCDTVEKVSAFYGEEWNNIPRQNLMDKKYFREIPEFLNSKNKTLPCKSVEDLSKKVVKYTRNDSSDTAGEAVKRWYWPLVKCVTVRVPGYNLQHVTLVDLPGNGDNNNSRDSMWREVVKNCSTVWIVTEINRAASEKESWEILESASSLMGNGGECQQIHFICTKSDSISSAADRCEDIIQRNMGVKQAVKKKFNKTKKIKKHFGDECLEVLTVSSKAFLEGNLLQQADTEIPKLKELLQNLNDSHSETLKYVSGALGILSVIQGVRSGAVVDTKTKVRAYLEKKLNELDEIRKAIQDTYKGFEERLTEGVKESERSGEDLLKYTLYPQKTGGFWKILQCVAKNGGIYKPKKGKQINLNAVLASRLTDSIDEEFRKTFPNDRKCEPFNGVISTFSLGTERLTEKYKDVELQLTFLKTEEEKIKTELNKIIREDKKTIYNSLTETIRGTMKECYKEAAGFTGTGTLENMRKTLEKHVCGSKNIMFKEAKYAMLEQLKKLMEYVLKKLEETLKESIELSLKTDDHSIPDVSAELELVKTCYDQLKGDPDQTKVDDMETETCPSRETLERNVTAEDDVPAKQRLFEVRTQFIEGISEPNLKKLLDKLFSSGVINDGEMRSAKQNRSDPRDVIDMVRRKGNKASKVLITVLCEIDPFLSKSMGLM